MSNLIKDEISAKSGLEILGKVLPTYIFTCITALTAINPTWSVLFAAASGIINTWSDFGQARINELVQYIDEHREEFVDEIIATDKFKGVFLNVLERHMTEVMEAKRELLRGYLLGVGVGVQADFDYHSKILSVLDQISFEEIALLNFMNDNKMISALSQITPNFLIEGNTLPESRIKFLLQSLGNYGTVAVDHGRYDGPVYQMSPFGEIFLSFI